MKLLKKAAVGLLTAAMALSMLTACGGPSGGGGSTPANKPSNSGGSNQTGQVTTVSPVPTTDTEPGEDGEDKSNWSLYGNVNSSRYIQFQKTVEKKDACYVETITAGYNADKTKVYDMAMTSAQNGSMTYARIQYQDVGSEKAQDHTWIYQEDNGKYYNHVVVTGESADQKAIIKTELDPKNVPSSDQTTVNPTKVWHTTEKIGGLDYYVEIFYDSDGIEYKVCYSGSSSIPTYIFETIPDSMSPTAKYVSTVYRNVAYGTDKGLCTIPSGYTVYTLVFTTYDNYGNPTAGTLTDEKGNVYTIADGGDTILVTDKNGNDVADDFTWIFKAMAGNS